MIALTLYIISIEKFLSSLFLLNIFLLLYIPLLVGNTIFSMTIKRQKARKRMSLSNKEEENYERDIKDESKLDQSNDKYQ